MSFSALTLTASTLGCIVSPEDSASMEPSVLYQDNMQRFDENQMAKVEEAIQLASELISDAVNDLKTNRNKYLATMPETVPMISYGSDEYIDTRDAYNRVVHHLETAIYSRDPQDTANWNVGFHTDCTSSYACTPEFDYCQISEGLGLLEEECDITYSTVTHTQIEDSLPWLPTFIDEGFLAEEEDLCEKTAAIAHESTHNVGLGHEPDVTEGYDNGSETEEDVLQKDIPYRVGNVFYILCEERYQ